MHLGPQCLEKVLKSGKETYSIKIHNKETWNLSAAACLLTGFVNFFETALKISCWCWF